ncbi:unnamed protein product [Sphagnum compactum]
MEDCRNWNEKEYRASIVAERDVHSRTIFAAAFVPATASAVPEHVATASSNGSVALYPVQPSVSSSSHVRASSVARSLGIAKPSMIVGKHDGPAYGLLSYGEDDNALLLSCGDDGRIQGWRWKEIHAALSCETTSGRKLQPTLDFRNPQQRGPFSALCPIPETNALAANSRTGCLFAAAGDGCAYAWDMETGKNTMVFQGHSDYLHCIASRPSHNQIITGSEDGTARIWDCRSGECVAALDPWNAVKISKKPMAKLPWISCLSLDASDNWLVCGNGGHCVTLWSLPGLDCVTRICMRATPQAVTIANDQILTVGTQPILSRWSFGGTLLSQAMCAPLSAFSVSVHPSGLTAVAGYGGLVDIISEFGSHLCTFCCG